MNERINETTSSSVVGKKEFDAGKAEEGRISRSGLVGINPQIASIFVMN